MNDFETAREQFTALKNMTYLNWAGLGPLPRNAKEAVEGLLTNIHEWNGEYMKEAGQTLEGKARGQLSSLLHTTREQIAFTGSSTSNAVQTALDSIHPRSGESIVTSDMQYILTEAEMQKWRDQGVDIRIVRNRNGIYEANDFDEAVDDTTKAVLLDSVTWINGYKFDIPEIARIAHEHDAYMITDSIQHIGQAKLDTTSFGADMVACGTQKWLSNYLGLGFLYVDRKIIEGLERPHYGYKNTEEPEGGWGYYFTRTDREDFPEFRFDNSTALKLEYGGSLYNMGGLAAVAETVGLINGIGMERIQKRILELKHRLAEGLEDLDLEVLPPYEEKHQSGITTFSMGIGRENEMKVAEKLGELGIAVSYRAGGGMNGIRASHHYVNNEDDIDRFISALKPLKKGA